LKLFSKKKKKEKKFSKKKKVSRSGDDEKWAGMSQRWDLNPGLSKKSQRAEIFNHVVMRNGRDEPEKQELRFNQVVMKKKSRVELRSSVEQWCQGGDEKWPELRFKSKVEQCCDLNPQGWAEKSESWDLNQVVVEKWPELRFEVQSWAVMSREVRELGIQIWELLFFLKLFFQKKKKFQKKKEKGRSQNSESTSNAKLDQNAILWTPLFTPRARLVITPS
jgi:hypothetical protein